MLRSRAWAGRRRRGYRKTWLATRRKFPPRMAATCTAAVLRPAGHLARMTELRLFDHVEPEGVDLIGAAPEVGKLLWHVQAVLLQTL